MVVDTRFSWLAAPGRFESIGQALKSVRIVGGERDTAAAVASRQASSLREWEAQYGMTAEEWLERYSGADAGRPPERDPRQMLPRGGSGDPRRRRAPGAEMYSEPPVAAGRDGYAARAEAGMPRKAPVPSGRSRAPAEDPPQMQARGPQNQGRPDDWDGQADGWGPALQRPAFGDVLQQDGRSYEYDEIQAQPPSKRRGDVIRSEDAF